MTRPDDVMQPQTESAMTRDDAGMRRWREAVGAAGLASAQFSQNPLHRLAYR